MNTKAIYITVALCAIVLVLAISSLTSTEVQELEAETYDTSKQLRYSFEIRNTSADFISETQFSAFAPVTKTSSQKVAGIQASLPYDLEVDDHGNQLMHFKIQAIPPFGTKIIVVTADLKVSQRPNQLVLSDNQYVGDHPFLQIEHPEIQATAQRLHDVSKGNSRAVFDWVGSHIDYSGFDPKDRGALYALETAQGDCTEYSYLTAALVRAQGIPARVLGGFVLSADTNVLAASAYHNWAEVFEDNRWKLNDAQKGAFDEAYENYIAFRVIEPGAKSMSNTHRFLAFDPRLEVMMN